MMRVLFFSTILCLVSLQATADICPTCNSTERIQIEAAYQDALAKATYAYYHLKEVPKDLILQENATRYNYWYRMSANQNDWWLNYHYEQVLRTATGVYGALKNRNFLVRNATPEEEEEPVDDYDGVDGCVKNGFKGVGAFVDYPDKSTGKDYGFVLCPKIWNDNEAVDVWGRVFVHELAHNFGTGDRAYCGS
jgi:hypothetical protein